MKYFLYASSCSLLFHDLTFLHPLSFHSGDYSTFMYGQKWSLGILSCIMKVVHFHVNFYSLCHKVFIDASLLL